MNKKMVSAGLAAGLLAGTGAGLILQMSGSAGAAGTSTAAVQVDDTTDTSSDTTATDDAAAQADRTARLQEVLQPLVDDGTLTQDQLDKVIATLDAAGPIGGGHGGRGPGGPGLATVAETLGMTEAEVKDAISNGQTLAQLAEAKGLTGQALIDALLADLKAHLDEEVAAGEHTQEEADAKLADATTRITDFVNNTDTAMAAGGPGGRGPGGPHGDRDGDSSTGTDSGSIDGGPADSTATTGA
jgi:hypothetical protein